MREITVSPVVAEAIRDMLLALLRQGRTVRCVSAGCSMRPWIRAGDALVMKRQAPETFRPGDLAVFVRETGNGEGGGAGAMTVHRVTRGRRFRGESGVLTRGDARARGGWIAARRLEGKVVRIDRGDLSIDPERFGMRWRARGRAALSELRALARLLLRPDGGVRA
ncbi:MAG: hypothetical protein HY608_08600 [Planctomycetes bacterium]|nr:hypothetical protein [Planctomycetota bacterium]